jgi:hypothetical protein
MAYSAGRRWSIRILLVTGTLLAIVSIFAVWANRQLLDEDNWADTSSQILENPAVQSQLAGFLVDEIYTNVDVAEELRSIAPPRLAPFAGLAAGALRSPAESVIQKALDRPRVQEAWRVANRFAAAQFIAIVKGESKVVETEGDTVTLNLREILTNLVDRLGLPGTLVGKIPEDAGQLKVLTADQVSLVRNGTSAVSGLSVLLPILWLIAFGTAIALAVGRRRHVLLWVGIDLMLAGALVLIGRTLLINDMVDSMAATEAVRPAVQAVWVIGSHLLKDVAQAGIVLGIPVVLGAIAAGDTRPAVSLRRLAAPTMRDRPAVVFGVEAVVVLLVVWWGPIPATRNLVPLLALVILLTIGVEALRRQTAAEFPPGDAEAARAALRERTRQVVSRPGRSDGDPAEARTATSRTPDDLVAHLERLEGLHDRGVLTDEEFAGQKTAALSGVS